MARTSSKRRTLQKAPANNLRMIRTAEGLKITELAAHADVSTKTITAIEYRSRNVSPEMRHRILNGLNRNPKRSKEHRFEDIFPNSR